MSYENCPMCGSPIDECECEDAIEKYTAYIDTCEDSIEKYTAYINTQRHNLKEQEAFQDWLASERLNK